MKRVLMVAALVSMFLSITAFDCDSKELDSAKLYIKQKQYDKAKEMLDSEISKNPQSDDAHYLYGNLLGEEGKIPEMVEHYEKSLSISPKYSEEIKQSRLYYWGTNYNKGAATMKKVAETDSEERKESLLDSALTCFKNAAASEPDSAISYHGLTLVYLNNGDLENAVSPAKKYLELKKTPEAYSLVGDVYYSLGAYEMEKFKASGDKADSVSAIGQYDEAIKILQDGRTLYPDNKELLEKVSNMYIAAKKLDVAVEAFKEGVEKNPENKQYRYNYGVVLLNAGNLEEAAAQFQKAVDLDPEYANALYNLAVVYIRWGQQIRDHNEANPDDATNVDYKPKFEQAITPLEKYLEINPEESAIWNLLGKVYANIGQSDKANEAFKRADEYK